jgi:hypothetical protein
MSNKSIVYRLGYFAAKYPLRCAAGLLLAISIIPLNNIYWKIQIDQAKELGFESVKHMKEVQSMGFENMSEFNESRAKKVGFSDYATMKEANAKGYKSMEAYANGEELKKHEEQKKAKQDIFNELLPQVNKTCANGNQQAEIILGSKDLRGVHSFCWGFNAALGDLVKSTNRFKEDLEDLSLNTAMCDSISESEARKFMSLGRGKMSFCRISSLSGGDASGCLNNVMSICLQSMQEMAKAHQLIGDANDKLEKYEK